MMLNIFHICVGTYNYNNYETAVTVILIVEEIAKLII